MDEPGTNIFEKLSQGGDTSMPKSQCPKNSNILEESRRRLLAPSTTPNNEKSNPSSTSVSGGNIRRASITVQTPSNRQHQVVNVQGMKPDSVAMSNGYVLTQVTSTTSRLEPLFAAKSESGNSFPVRVDNAQQKEVTAAIAPKIQKDTRILWASKINLQAACGSDPEENLRLSDVVDMSVETIRNLETEDMEKRTEITNLMKEQAHLLDRVAYYKKMPNVYS